MGFIPSWAIGVGVIIIAVQLGRVVSRMLGMPPHSPRSLRRGNDDADDVRQALEAMQQRVTELEERVDFTERLLAKHREADRLSS